MWQQARVLTQVGNTILLFHISHHLLDPEKLIHQSQAVEVTCVPRADLTRLPTQADMVQAGVCCFSPTPYSPF